MRVVLVVHRFPTPSETFFVQRFRRLSERGLDMHVVCEQSRASDWRYFADVDPSLRAKVHVRPRSTPRALAALLAPLVVVRTFVRAPKATLRFLVRGWRRYRFRIVRRLYRDAPLIVLAPDVVHFGFGSYAVSDPALGRLLDCATCVSFQGFDLNYDGLDRPGYFDEVWKTVDAFHFQGADLQRRASRRGFAADGRETVIWPGIDTSAFVPPSRTASEGPLRILSVGRLHWKKGYGYALQAIRMVVDEGIDCRYRIIGDGDGRDAVLFDRSDLALDEIVELLGPQPGDRVQRELAETDVFLHAATSEGFCYAVLEAQAMEVPVVTSDADGLRENVADGETGLVVPRRHPEDLALGIMTLARDPALRERMGKAGRARVLSGFTVDAETDAFEKFYRKAMEHRGR